MIPSYEALSLAEPIAIIPISSLLARGLTFGNMAYQSA